MCKIIIIIKKMDNEYINILFNLRNCKQFKNKYTKMNMTKNFYMLLRQFFRLELLWTNLNF